MKQFRIRYYYEVMQEDIIEAEFKEEAEAKAEDIVWEWDMENPKPEFLDSPHNELVVEEIEQ